MAKQAVKKSRRRLKQNLVGWGSVSYTHLDVYKRQECMDC